MNSILGNKLIEIDEQEIRIKKGNQKETINLGDVEKIILKDEYTMPQETLKEIREEMGGKANKNYLIVCQDSKKRKLDFEVDSYYMINQLNKLIETWKIKGYNIERINHK